MGDVLLRNIEVEAQANKVEGLQMKRDFSELHHLFFTYGSFFTRATTQNTSNLKLVIDKYCQTLDERVNAGKSSLCFSANVDEQNMSDIENVCDIQNLET